MSTNRRAFLKAGALVAAPVAALAAPAALAADPRLAQLEDERAIAATLRGFLARFNAGGLARCDAYCASPLRIHPQVSRITPDPVADPGISLDGDRAVYQRAVEVHTSTAFAGDTTLEKMARFQGNPFAHSAASRSMTADFVRTPDGWRIANLLLH